MGPFVFAGMERRTTFDGLRTGYASSCPLGGLASLAVQSAAPISPPLATIFQECILVTWFTSYTGDIVNTFSRAKGLGPGSTRPSSLSKNPKSYCMKLTSQIWSSTFL